MHHSKGQAQSLYSSQQMKPIDSSLSNSPTRNKVELDAYITQKFIDCSIMTQSPARNMRNRISRSFCDSLTLNSVRAITKNSFISASKVNANNKKSFTKNNAIKSQYTDILSNFKRANIQETNRTEKGNIYTPESERKDPDYEKRQLTETITGKLRSENKMLKDKVTELTEEHNKIKESENTLKIQCSQKDMAIEKLNIQINNLQELVNSQSKQLDVLIRQNENKNSEYKQSLVFNDIDIY